MGKRHSNWRRDPVEILRSSGRPMTLPEIVTAAYGSPVQAYVISGWTSSVRKALTIATGTRCYKLGNDVVWEIQ